MAGQQPAAGAELAEPAAAGPKQRGRLPLPSLHVPGDTLYVNAKQYGCIVRRRQQRAKEEPKARVAKIKKVRGTALVLVLVLQLPGSARRARRRARAPQSSASGSPVPPHPPPLGCLQPYLHESRHVHATRRIRGAGGRFLASHEVRQLMEEQLQQMLQQEAPAGEEQALAAGGQPKRDAEDEGAGWHEQQGDSQQQDAGRQHQHNRHQQHHHRQRELGLLQGPLGEVHRELEQLEQLGPQQLAGLQAWAGSLAADLGDLDVGEALGLFAVDPGANPSSDDSSRMPLVPHAAALLLDCESQKSNS